MVRCPGAGDTRETPAIDVCKGLMEEGAKLKIYDPQVSFQQIQMDLSLNKFEWDGPAHTLKAKCAPSHFPWALNTLTPAPLWLLGWCCTITERSGNTSGALSGRIEVE
ncbi:MAG: hypothetical protein HC767_15040 [Akkermansiaceae bacterium]|nr:hypothetical protein [Akkermansiaceae bacterium]